MPTPIGPAHVAPIANRVPVAPVRDPVALIRPDQFRDFIKQGDVVVEFMNFGCPYCRDAAPHLDKVAREKLGGVKFGKMSLGDPMAQALAAQFGTTMLPGFALFRDGAFLGSFGRQGREPVTADFIRANVDYAFSTPR
jgi:thioredoxin-like negative regulator of GroEL